MTLRKSTTDNQRIGLTAFIPFLLITFGLAWGIVAAFICFPEGMTQLFGALSGNHPLFFLAVYAPAIGAFFVVLRSTGPGGLRRFLSRLFLWRASPVWYAFLVAGIPLLFAGGAAWKGNLLTEPFPFSSGQTVLAALALMAVKGPIEEFGWRGLALPLLQRKVAPIWAGLMVGLVWGFWHLPAFLLSGTPQSAWSFTPFFAGSIALSVIVTALFNASRGSILLPALFHFQVNNPLWPDAQPYDTVAFVAAAVLVVWIHRKSMFSREGGVTEIVPPIAHRGRTPLSGAAPMEAVEAHPNRAWTMRRHRVELLALGLLGIFFTHVPCQPVSANPLSLKGRFQSELDALRGHYQFPGATAAYILPDGTVEVVATGLADVESATPMMPQSRMLAASIGKTFAGATVLSLVGEGRLALDAPIASWLDDRPWFSRLPHGNSITLRQLLTHRSGLANHVETEGFRNMFRQQWNDRGNPIQPEALIAFVLDQPPLFAPGSGWHYSDTGYLLVGLIIERVTGHSYFEEVNRRFLAPLGLVSTAPSDRLELPGLATGYLAPDNPFGLPAKTTVRPGVMAWHPGVEWTGGGFISNPQDLVVWARMLFEGRALEGPYLDALFQSVPIGEEEPATRYGIGVGIYENGPLGLTYGHGGWIPGYCSSVRYYAREGVAVAFQINTDIGIVDGSSSVIEDAEIRLATVVLTRASRE